MYALCVGITLFETVTSYYIIEMAGRPAGHTALRTYMGELSTFT